MMTKHKPFNEILNAYLPAEVSVRYTRFPRHVCSNPIQMVLCKPDTPYKLFLGLRESGRFHLRHEINIACPTIQHEVEVNRWAEEVLKTEGFHHLPKEVRTHIHCTEVACACTPKSVTGTIWSYSINNSGAYYPELIECPYPTNPYRLFVYFHECAHIELNHFERCETDLVFWECIAEFEATRWALQKLVENGFKLPMQNKQVARNYVLKNWLANEEEGLTVDKLPDEMRRWLGLEADQPFHADWWE